MEGILCPAEVGQEVVGPEVVGPSVAGPAVVGPAVVGLAVVGPALVGPAAGLAWINPPGFYPSRFIQINPPNFIHLYPEKIKITEKC